MPAQDIDWDAYYRDEDLREYRAESLMRRRHHQALYRHPDPRDPNYPGDWPGQDEEETE